MNTWNRVCRAVTMIVLSLFCLSGCGGGSSTGGVGLTAGSTVQAATKVPDAPAGVSAVGGTNKVTITWSAVSGATSYNIYWSATAGVTATTGTRITNTGVTYIHRALLPAATYYYIVTALNSSGESGASAQVSNTTSALDGAVLYTANCSGCHGSLATSTAINSSVTDIKSGLQNRAPMRAISVIDSQITAISAALMDSN